ncbi:hypothetical protein AMTR_s00010p00011570 [Amborella trichopoda]|uniref:Uncharacterized protein n=1 Tax=Amborella trichopoda TaxID=13333 RepID=W1NEY6_AMBTC|nr:hypothetical protein AMTR_s00010p00011570 [Amborella trichopoda]
MQWEWRARPSGTAEREAQALTFRERKRAWGESRPSLGIDQGHSISTYQVKLKVKLRNRWLRPFPFPSQKFGTNPTAIMIGRTALAQDDVSGDGTISTVLFIGELMKQSERYIDKGMHPRVLVDGFEIAERATLEFLEKFQTPVVMGDEPDKDILKMVARTTLRTKLYEALADQLTDIVVNAVLCIRKPDEPIDLFMVEIMLMRHKFDVDTRLVEGLVLDHRSGHPDMKRPAENCHILTCNVSLEYEKRSV